jgi:ferredoxin
VPKLTINNQVFDVPEGKRLVLAIEGNGVNIGHRCGGYARCTTCRVEFKAGEPETMTRAEYQKLVERDLFGRYRLSCQILCDHDMSVRPAITLETEPAWHDTGPPPEETVTPEAEWYSIESLQQGG